MKKDKNISENNNINGENSEKYLFDDLKKSLLEELNARIENILPKYTADDLLTIPEVCDLFKKNKSTIWKWTKTKTLLGYKVGGTVYYKKSEIFEHIDRNLI